MKTRHMGLAGLLGLLSLASLAVAQSGATQDGRSRRAEFAYAVNQNSNTISGYKVGVNGALTPLAKPSYATGNAPNSVAVEPRGRFLYVANVVSNDVSGFVVGEDGSLKPIAGSPFPAGSGPGWVTIDPTGRFVYLANCAALCSGSGQGSVSGLAL